MHREILNELFKYFIHVARPRPTTALAFDLIHDRFAACGNISDLGCDAAVTMIADHCSGNQKHHGYLTVRNLLNCVSRPEDAAATLTTLGKLAAVVEQISKLDLIRSQFPASVAYQIRLYW